MSFRALNSWSALGGALALLMMGTGAGAQEETPTPPPSSTTPPITDTTPEPGQEKLPPCPLPQSEAAPAETPPAEAQPLVTPTPAPAAAPVATTHHRKHNIVFAPQEISLVTGAGVGNYFGKASPGSIETGPTWDARATFGAHSII